MAIPNVVYTHAYIQFCPPWSNKEIVPIEQIVSSAGPIQHVGKRETKPFAPNDPDLRQKPDNPHGEIMQPFLKNEVYVCETSAGSKDGKKHPYYCLIGRLGVSFEELQLDVSSREKVKGKGRVSFPNVPYNLGEPESSTSDVETFPDGFDAFEASREQSRTLRLGKQVHQENLLKDILAKTPKNRIPESISLELQKENDKLKAELKRKEKEVQEYSKRLRESQSVQSQQAAPTDMAQLAAMFKNSLKEALTEVTNTVAHTIDQRFNAKFEETVNPLLNALRQEKENCSREFLGLHVNQIQMWVNSIIPEMV